MAWPNGRPKIDTRLGLYTSELLTKSLLNGSIYYYGDFKSIVERSVWWTVLSNPTRNIAIANRSRASSAHSSNSRFHGEFNQEEACDTPVMAAATSSSTDCNVGYNSSWGANICDTSTDFTENREIYIPHVYSTPPYNGTPSEFREDGFMFNIGN